MSDNLFYNTVGQSTMLREARNTTDFQWINNIAFGKPLGLNVVPDGLTIADPQLVQYNRYLHFPEASAYGADKEAILEAPMEPSDVFGDDCCIKARIIEDATEEFSLNNFKFDPIDNAMIHTDTAIPELATNANWQIGLAPAVLMVDSNRGYQKAHLRYIDENNPDVAPYERDGSVFVPVRFAGEGLGATVQWDPSEEKMWILKTRGASSWLWGAQ